MTAVIYWACLGFLLSVIFTKITIIREKFLGIVSKDLHKPGKPEIPKIGGIGIAIAFTITMAVAYAVKGSIVYPIIMLGFLVSTAIGLLDDYVQFQPWRKLVLPTFGAIPLLILISWDPITIIFLFALVSVASNWTNMLAGFNGLETGLGAIMLFFMALNTQAVHPQLSLFIYAAVLLGFLVFNKYPAKIFPGDAGTLPIGTVLVATTLLGAPLFKLGILFIPHAIDAGLKFASKGVISSTDHNPSTVKNNFLVPGKSYLSLSKLLMKVKPLKEWQLVAIFWGIEIGLGVVTLIL